MFHVINWKLRGDLFTWFISLLEMQMLSCDVPSTRSRIGDPCGFLRLDEMEVHRREGTSPSCSSDC